jgi:hypothetical protein
MNYPTSYTSTVSVPLSDDAAIRSVVGDTYDPGTALNVIKMFAGTGDLYPALIGMVTPSSGPRTSTPTPTTSGTPTSRP